MLARSSSLWLPLLLALAPALAAAQEDGEGGGALEEDAPPGIPPAAELESPQLRVAVLLLPTGEVDETAAEGLGELLIGAVASRGGVRIVGREEFQAQLGQGDAGTLECVSSMTCLGRVGVQLGVREVIAGTLAHRGDEWIFNINRVDVREGALMGRVFREVRGDLGAVADALGAAVPELYEPPRSPGVLVFAGAPAGAEVTLDGVLVGRLSSEPLRREDVEPGRHEIRVEAPGHAPWSRVIQLSSGAEVHLEPTLAALSAPVERVEESIHPLFFVGAGVSAAALGVAIALGVSSQDGFDPLGADARQEGEVSRAEAVAFYEARGREATGANVLFVVAGLAAITGVVALFFPVRVVLTDGEAGASLQLAPGGLEGRF
ncbi:MAG: PEGA domain-containing protein [Sandaracinaceae bacterium]|nr:MAG: PEGA domain-containing protein [Sandaracinaceae bacterium]